MKATCDQISDGTGQKPALAAVSRFQSPTRCNNRCEIKVCFWANKPLNLRQVCECRAVDDMCSNWPTSGGETCIPDKHLDYSRSLQIFSLRLCLTLTRVTNHISMTSCRIKHISQEQVHLGQYNIHKIYLRWSKVKFAGIYLHSLSINRPGSPTLCIRLEAEAKMPPGFLG